MTRRYEQSTYVEAYKPRRMPQDALQAATRGATAIQAYTDVSGALTPIQGDTREVTSATDRAHGYVLRMGAIGVVGLIVAGAGTLAFVLVAVRLGASPPALVRLFVFLLVLGGLLIWAAVTMNATDYEHSRPGVELYRLDVAERMHERALAAELEIRRAALAASLQMMERGNYDIDG